MISNEKKIDLTDTHVENSPLQPAGKGSTLPPDGQSVPLLQRFCKNKTGTQMRGDCKRKADFNLDVRELLIKKKIN